MVSTTKSPPHSSDFERWLSGLKVNWSAPQIQLIQKIHEDVLAVLPASLSGLTAADLLADLRLDHEAIAAALLHEAVESATLPLATVAEHYGDGIATLVDNVARLDIIGAFHQHGLRSQARLENLRKMLLAMARDVRVVLIKLAIRVCQMRQLDSLPENIRREFAQETLDIFTPLANRLGIGQFKWEMEDLSLRCLDPEHYKKIAHALDQRRTDRETHIEVIMQQLRQELEQANINGEISGRAKHIYSIWKKMQRKQLPFEQIFDIRAVRILVDSVAECYSALGIVHGLWQNIPREFDDYIANPKENGYQSLHTAVIGPEGKTLEVQIRSHHMHQSAELGVAAHWRYKEGGGQDQSFEKQIAWLRQLLEWQDETTAADDFIEHFKAEVFRDRVYVLTPGGDIIDLAQGATPLDFAYHIHTEVGHRCRGAKVNGRIVPLNYELQNGEQVEVLTAKVGSPSRNWLHHHLGYLKTSRARAKVRHWFHQQDREKNIAAGRAALEQELRRLGVNSKTVNLSKLAAKFNFSKAEELYAAIGSGDFTITSVVAALQELLMPSASPKGFLPVTRKARSADAGGGIKISGVGNLLTQTAGCCKPVPFEPIIGFITQGRGVTIHRRDCSNLLNLESFHQERFIEVDWGEETTTVYAVDIQIDAYDRPGLLRDITAVLGNEKVNVTALNTESETATSMARMGLTLEVADLSQLSRVLDRIGQLSNVAEVQRKT